MTTIPKALSGHVSPETAYLVDDYPYGFRLRCQIRYWIEFKKGKGFRFVSQTSNPKVPGLVWNKPKASTYARFGGVLLRDESNGHISWRCLTEYNDLGNAEFFLEEFGAALCEEGRAELEKWVATKRRYEELKAQGHDYRVAGIIATAQTIGVAVKKTEDESNG